MDTVLVQFADPAGEVRLLHLGPGGVARFGRGAPGVEVDIPFTDPAVPRLAGEIRATGDHWTMTNLSDDTTYVVDNPEGAGEHVKVAPGRCGAPVPFEIARVVIPARRELVTFTVFAPMHSFVDRSARESDPSKTGDRTLAAFALDESSKYFLVLVALCEPRLRDQSYVAIPTVDRVVDRLRPLHGCADLTASAVTFHVDYLARTKLRVKLDGGRDDTKRAALVSLALRFNLVREEHLRLLGPRR